MKIDKEVDRERRRSELYQLLGDLPDRQRKVSVSRIDHKENQSYLVERLLLDLNGIEAVPAYFIYPKDGKGPFPAILYNHAHGGDYVLGKDELLEGRKGLQKPSYAEALTKIGYCVLCIDAWCFGERRGRSESETFKEMLWSGRILWGMMVYDSLRAIDYLLSRPDVDTERLATLGMSMGSTMSWWVAALDRRVKACVDICCLTDYQALIESRGLDRHGLYYYIPGLLKHFTTADINRLIVPRAHLSLAGIFDYLTPPKGLDRIDVELQKAYSAEGAESAWKLIRYRTGHFETIVMRQETLSFLKRWL